jgi:glycerophosphoryl diester phosphodiesterase
MNHSNHCLIFAHRGASAEATENTLSAFDSALQYGADGIETDVQLTKDEITVLWHDRFLGKIGLPKKHIDDFKYAQLLSMNFAGDSTPENKNNGIMRLQAFVDTYRDRCQLLLEIKNRDWESTLRHEIKVQQTLNIIGQVNDNTIIVSSFNLDSLKYAHHCRPKFPLIYNLEDDQTIADIKDILITCPFLHGLCLPIDILDYAIVELLREHEKCIAVYTCNSDEEISKALDLGVDILISDLPQKALMMRNA